MATPARRSVNIWQMSRPFTKPARMVPRNEPTTTARTCITSREKRSWRMFPATVNSSMLV